MVVIVLKVPLDVRPDKIDTTLPSVPQQPSSQRLAPHPGFFLVVVLSS